MPVSSQWLANPGSTYEIANSCRYNPGDNPKLSRTMTEGDRRQATFSWWIKRCGLGTLQSLFESGGAYEVVRFTTADQLLVRNNNSDVTTNRVFRDVNAWYHIVVTLDNDQGTAADRTKIFVNGVQETSFASAAYPASGDFTDLNDSGKLFQFGCANSHTTPTNEINGYFSQCDYLDGTAVSNTDLFAKTNSDGVYVPIETSLTYGTNGLQLLFGDSSALGDDTGGGGHDLASSGLAAADQVVDTPTDNFCVLSSIDKNSNFTLSDGNLTNSNGTNAHAACFGTIAFDSADTDGFYWEVNIDSMGSTGFAVLIADEGVNQTDISASPTTQPAEGNLWAFRRYLNSSEAGTTGVGATGSWTGYGPDVVNGDKIGFCVKNGKLFIAVNNTWLESSNPATEANPAFSNLTGRLRVGVNRFEDAGTDTTTCNFGQTGFSYTPPTGAKAISTANLATPSIAAKDGSAFFQATTYTGDGGSSHAINQAGNSTFEPSLVWIKSRSAATNNVLQDQVRGNFVIYSELANAQGATGGGWVNSFDSDGFTVNVNTPINDSGETFVGWQWKANGSGSSNTDGSITSSVSAETTAGFSIVKYTGTGSNATVGHGLGAGAVPKMIIIKDTTNAESWIVYHEGVGNDGNLYLNLTNGKATQAIFQDTTPTSSVFSLGTIDGANKASAGHVAYCFAEVPGYSSFGGWTGSGNADGVFIHTGFSPAFIMYKVTSTTDNWEIYDTSRQTFNVYGSQLKANLANAETNDTRIDILSNGFKARSTNSAVNASGATYIYMAFAEHSFGGDGVAPATAR